MRRKVENGVSVVGGTRNFQSFFICFFFLYFLNWKFVGYFYGIRADTSTPFILFFSPLKIYIFNLNKLNEIHHTIFDLFYFATTTRKYRNFNALFVYDINQQKKKKWTNKRNRLQLFDWTIYRYWWCTCFGHIEIVICIILINIINNRSRSIK